MTTAMRSRHTSRSGRGRRIRALLGRLGWMLTGIVLATIALWLWSGRRLPDLSPWHRVELVEELDADAGDSDFAGYLAREERLFAELERAVAGFGSSDPLSRYNPESPTWPGAFVPNWNRTVVLGPAAPSGGALLLHGLSDAPYSVRPVAELLADQGWRTVALRLPGHGTLPGELRRVDWEDWSHAVRLAATDLAGRLPPDAPLVLVGYSNGAALALEYTLAALDDPELETPDRLILLSPAIAVTPLAALARWQRLASHLPGMEKLSWTSVIPEYDPYKYNSFALQAGEQIHRLTNELERRLARLESERRTAELPPILTIQSTIDATVPPVSSLTRLYSRVPTNGSELLLFDINRLTYIELFLSGGHRALLDRLEAEPRLSFEVTVVTNASPGTRRVEERVRAAGSSSWVERPLDLEWPPGVYSLSHVAIPFPPEDPVYGVARDLGPPFPFGVIEARGERNVLAVSKDLLMRLRFNPFYELIEERVLTFCDLAPDD